MARAGAHELRRFVERNTAPTRAFAVERPLRSFGDDLARWDRHPDARGSAFGSAALGKRPGARAEAPAPAERVAVL